MKYKMIDIGTREVVGAIDAENLVEAEEKLTHIFLPCPSSEVILQAQE